MIHSVGILHDNSFSSSGELSRYLRETGFSDRCYTEVVNVPVGSVDEQIGEFSPSNMVLGTLGYLFGKQALVPVDGSNIDPKECAESRKQYSVAGRVVSGILSGAGISLDSESIYAASYIHKDVRNRNATMAEQVSRFEFERSAKRVADEINEKYPFGYLVYGAAHQGVQALLEERGITTDYKLALPKLFEGVVALDVSNFERSKETVDIELFFGTSALLATLSRAYYYDVHLQSDSVNRALSADAKTVERFLEFSRSYSKLMTVGEQLLHTKLFVATEMRLTNSSQADSITVLR